MSNEVWYVRDRNKVMGPFDREQLEALRRRGQLARFHEVSRDRTTWARASTLPSLFGSEPRVTPSEAAPVAGPGPRPAAPSWYYSSGQKPVGPVPEEEILGLLKRGTIGPTTLVWKEGLPRWVALRDAEFLGAPAPAVGPLPPGSSPPASAPSARRRRRRRASAVAAVLLVLAGSLAFYRYRDGHRTPRDGDPSDARPVGSSPIDSVGDSPELKSAVGLVLCGATVTEFDGTKTETCFSTGTCFVVSESGYLVTSRHVVDGISKLMNADQLRIELEEKKRTKLEPKIWVFFGRKKFTATIRYESDDFDLAVLKIEADRPLPRFRLGDRDAPPRGTQVYALGYPEASRIPLSGVERLEQAVRKMKKGVRVESHFHPSNFEYVITDGIISVVRREGGVRKVEHTARISGGNSGGPLVTGDGTVIGINMLIAKEEDNAVPTYVALGIAQCREELERNAPEIFAP